MKSFFYGHAWAERQKLGRAESLRLKYETLLIQKYKLLLFVYLFLRT